VRRRLSHIFIQHSHPNSSEKPLYPNEWRKKDGSFHIYIHGRPTWNETSYNNIRCRLLYVPLVAPMEANDPSSRDFVHFSRGCIACHQELAKEMVPKDIFLRSSKSLRNAMELGILNF
jgi:hypothetical protein